MVLNTESEQERHVLVVNDGKRRAIALDAAAYSIGRDPSNAIVMDADTISRQHAMLLRVPVPGTKQYRYRVLDGNSQGKASANGIFINGQKIASRELNHGDILRFGQSVEASYLKVSMGATEFAQYLESTAYQSIKTDTVNAKATLVAATSLSLLGDETVRQVTTGQLQAKGTRSESRGKPWAETRHEKPKSMGVRLWMVIVPSVLLLVSILAGAWKLTAGSRPAQSIAEPVQAAPNAISNPQ